jgi:hypothetical protein
MSSELYRIARSARKWAERNRDEGEHGEDLCGMCAIAAAELWGKLNRKNIEATIIVNETETHCFCLVDDLVVDVTATQFGYQEVFIASIDELLVLEETKNKLDIFPWTYGYEFQDRKKFVEYQRATGWPASQTARE